MHSSRGSLYVGAFLRRSSDIDVSETTTPVLGDTIKDDSPDPAAHLYEVGTFAQVHTVIPGGELSDMTHLMLLGHKRIRRLNIVGLPPSGDGSDVWFLSLGEHRSAQSDESDAEGQS